MGLSLLDSFAEPSGEPQVTSSPLHAYAFRVDADGLILDPNGAPVAVADVPSYVKGLGVANVTITALWIDGPEAAKKLAPTIAAFGGRFTKIIVKIWEPGDKTGFIDLPAPTKKSVSDSIAAAYPGRSYPSSLLAQSLELRSVELRPEPIPGNISYRYADRLVVEEAARRIRLHFIMSEGGPNWAGVVAVQSGAWKLFREDGSLGKSYAIRYSARVPTSSGVRDFQQILLHDPGEIRELDSKVREVIAADGGGQVRALRAEEMKAWWPFISYDIIEPIFVLETSNMHHRFILGVNQDGIGLLDELSGLARF
jgi:hypothetical protein